ncbi:DUF4136 domain-containing protein [Dyadobacter chenwenxiniae]|uniref:DUF4136 domain-containing protein n=1 Tax=Dyadobacter chenwenxiniae TaxID=2906456 RepID=A0A9X1PRX3_9BACT|nr:DUF4136 domain-containing protein [Dyadobacter chenwenxiniae]MCF0053722.1 DUF4136 domain-containing protein [Dyadobacter chenwenxiniae]MCF0063951.1 DUF4136 domain-containing protein [Dyadobacter chenwenxiniae]UON82679.1 DUF4136 domain-containing protein [Dyadobacter chenwenxiniae]
MKTIVKLMKSTAAVVVAGLLMMGCSQALQTSYDYDSSVNLKQFKTFKVEAEHNMEQDPLLGSELNRRRLGDAVVEVMEAKGYKMDTKNPDIIVRFMTDVKERQQVRSNNMYSPYMWWYGGGNNISTYNYQESRFILNIYQKNSDRMVWQGWASGKVKAPTKKEDRETMVKNTMTDILKTFPQATLDTYSRN